MSVQKNQLILAKELTNKINAQVQISKVACKLKVESSKKICLIQQKASIEACSIEEPSQKAVSKFQSKRDKPHKSISNKKDTPDSRKTYICDYCATWKTTRRDRIIQHLKECQTSNTRAQRKKPDYMVRPPKEALIIPCPLCPLGSLKFRNQEILKVFINTFKYSSYIKLN